MTPAQSKRLKFGQRVAWHDSADDQGTVTASDWSGVRIEWDNGKNQFFHHNNMGEVEVASQIWFKRGTGRSSDPARSVSYVGSWLFANFRFDNPPSEAMEKNKAIAAAKAVIQQALSTHFSLSLLKRIADQHRLPSARDHWSVHRR